MAAPSKRQVTIDAQILDRLIGAALDLRDALLEAHNDEIENDHYGDGPDGCSYCCVAEAVQQAVRDARASAAHSK